MPNFIVSDETLRDGRQQVYVNFTESQMVYLAPKIADAGIHWISLMPAISSYEQRLTKKLVENEGLGDHICASTLMKKDYIDMAYRCKVRRLFLIADVSDRLVTNVRGLTRDENYRETVEGCRYAHRKGIKVNLALVDATRADFSYLVRVIEGTGSYVDFYLPSDTVGISTPQSTKRFITDLKEKTPYRYGFHGHNDHGYAVDNTIAAVEAGAELVSGTFGDGLGERAGNASLLDVLNRLKKEKSIVIPGIKYRKLPDVNDIVLKFAGTGPAEPYSPRAFYHKSGVHVDGLLKDELSYCPFSLEEMNEMGREHRIFFGEHSGKSNLRHMFGDGVSEKELEVMLDKVKKESHRLGIDFSEEQIKDMFPEMIPRKVPLSRKVTKPLTKLASRLH